MRGPFSVRIYLVALCLGIVLPLLLFSGFVVMRVAAREQDALTASARYRTRIAAAAIDTELFSLRSRLLLLAGSLSPPIDDLREMQAKAERLFEGLTVVLSETSGREIFNTAVPFGESLPNFADLVLLGRVASTRQPLLGGLSNELLAGYPVATINVPVTGTDGPVSVLSLDIAPLLPRFLSQRDLPEGWVAVILDRQGRIIGRSHRPEQYLGQMARPDFIERIQANDQGWGEGFTREGTPVFSAFAHTTLGGWTIVVAVPRRILMAPREALLAWLLLLGGFALILALGLAVAIGRRLTAAIAGLVPIAEAVGHGDPAPAFVSGLIEANTLADSLREASDRLRQTDEERRALVGRTVVAQEEERKRIARELHDSLAQYLTALGLTAEKLRLTQDQPTRAVLTEELRRSIGALGQELTRLTWELRPVALDGLGMREAIELYLEEWSDRASLPVDVAIDLPERNLPREIEATLFRVLQEATNNVLRHAGATRLGVILESRGQEIRLLIEDNGKGFVLSEGGRSGPTRQLGLVGMRERLALVRGSLEVESSPDSGTTIYVRIPIGQEIVKS